MTLGSQGGLGQDLCEMPGAFPDPTEGDFASEGDPVPPNPAQAFPNHFFSAFNPPKKGDVLVPAWWAGGGGCGTVLVRGFLLLRAVSAVLGRWLNHKPELWGHQNATNTRKMQSYSPAISSTHLKWMKIMEL